MSYEASKWLNENWPTLRHLTYTEPNGKTRPAFQGDAAILASVLMDHLNAHGTWWAKARTLEEWSGVPERAVRRILAGWESAGYCERIGDRPNPRGNPSPEYAWKLGGLYRPEQLAAKIAAITDPKPAHKGSQLMSQGTRKKSSTANNDKAFGEIDKIEPEPEPEPAANGEGAGGWGTKHEQLLADILSCEDMTGDKGRLRDWLTKKYRPLVIRAIRDQPAPDLVAWCLDMKRGIEHKAEFDKQPCPVCHDHVFIGAGDPLHGKKALWAGQSHGWVECANCQPWLVTDHAV